MKIRLNEVPAEGREYTFSRKTAELNEALQDLVGDHDYDVEFFIKPIGNAFELRGRFQTTLNEVCSKCGTEFELGVNRAISEILIEDRNEYRKQETAGGNQSVDFLSDGPSMIPIRGNVFDAGDFVHEAIALAEPSYPTCGPKDECLNFDEISQVIERLEAESNLENEKKPVGHPAFSALEGLKVTKSNSKN